MLWNFRVGGEYRETRVRDGGIPLHTVAFVLAIDHK